MQCSWCYFIAWSVAEGGCTALMGTSLTICRCWCWTRCCSLLLLLAGWLAGWLSGWGCIDRRRLLWFPWSFLIFSYLPGFSFTSLSSTHPHRSPFGTLSSSPCTDRYFRRMWMYLSFVNINLREIRRFLLSFQYPIFPIIDRSRPSDRKSVV